MIEREITAPIDLCTRDGRLDPRAVGWARQPLFFPNLRGAWPRKKRWAYWGITSPDFVLALTLADADYAGIAVVTLIDVLSHEMIERAAITPLGARVAMPAGVRDPIDVSWLGFSARTIEEPRATRIEVRARGIEADLVIDRPELQESLNVVVPFGDPRRFQLTSKHVGLRARGEARAWGRTVHFDDAFACLDYGRGVWPWRTRWQWAAGACEQGGRTIGFNLGGTWTRGSGVTENALFVDGRVHKISEELSFVFSPGGVKITAPSGRVALDLEPIHPRDVSIGAGPLKTRLAWRYGRFSGALVTGEGERILVGDLLGWAEDHTARW